MREADRFEKAMERSGVGDEAIRLHLLLHVQSDVRIQCVRRVWCVPDDGQQAHFDCRVQTESRPEFRGHEWMHDAQRRTTRQQIDACSLELSGTGAGEHEARAMGPLNQLVHNGQQFRYPLQFVNRNVVRARVRSDQAAQALGTGRIDPLLCGREEVDPERTWKCVQQLGALPRFPQSEQEGVPNGMPKKSPFNRHNSTHYGNSCRILQETHS